MGGDFVLVAYYGTVSRFHGDIASVFQFPCQVAVSPGIACRQCIGRSAMGGGDFLVRACLLFCHLPVGGDAGHRFLFLRQTEEI